MKSNQRAIHENLCTGAIYGIKAWTIYAIVECWFSVIFPWIIDQNSYQTRFHWGFTILLIFTYIMIGLIIGIGAGLAFSVSGRFPIFRCMNSSIFFAVVSTLTITLAFDVSLVLNYSTSSVKSLRLSEFPPLFMSFLMTFGLILSICSSSMFKRLRFLTNPWTISIVLIGLPWIYNEVLYEYSRAVNIGAVIVYNFIVLLGSFIILKILQTWRRLNLNTETQAIVLRYLLIVLVVVVIIQGFIFFERLSPPSLNLDRRSSSPSSRFNYPNIILITMDTVRADHVSLYGYSRETTPNLRKLAEESTLYTRFIASGAMTLSTHASIFTGMYSKQHGAHFDPWNNHPFGRPLAEKFQTLAEVLSGIDYFTMGIVSNPNFLSHFYGLDQGFQYYDCREFIPFLSLTRPYMIRHLIREILVRFAPREAFDMEYRRAGEINEEAYRIVNKVQEKESPFFLFINYMDAHNPYMPPSPFDMLYPGKDVTFTSARYYSLGLDIIKLKRNITEEEQNHLISQYDGAIAYIDFHIGKLLERLDELGLFENSLIIIASDHGEAFGEKMLFNHGVSVYQDQIHVPLIIKYPNSRQKIVVDEVVSIIDLMPTILDVLGQNIPGDLQGKSLLRQEARKSKIVISESYPSGDLIRHHERFNRVAYAIFSGFYKFTSSTKGKKELYFLSEDPDENENIYHSNKIISKKFETILGQWLESTRAEYESSIIAKPDKETLERLKSLGYIK